MFLRSAFSQKTEKKLFYFILQNKYNNRYQKEIFAPKEKTLQ